MNNVQDSEDVNSVNNKLQTTPSVLTRERILEDYSDVFEGLGCMDGLYHMELDKTVKPVVHVPRKVPVALRECLKEDLDKLVKGEVITPVTEPTNWVSSLVLVNKPDKLRICIDPQDLNKALLSVTPSQSFCLHVTRSRTSGILDLVSSTREQFVFRNVARRSSF